MSISFAQSPLTVPRSQKLYSIPIARNRLRIVNFWISLPFSNARRFVLDERRPSRCRIRVFSSGENIDGFRQGEVFGELSLDTILSVIEILFIVPPAIYSIGCAVGLLVPGAVKPLQTSLGSKIFVWQFLLLVGSVAIGSLIRWRQWARICRESERGVNVDLLARIEKVEEDLRSSATIVRVLSRQLEKLGIRFRVTTKALKEPITEEQQQKQLELILAIGKAGRLFESKGDASPPVEQGAAGGSNPVMNPIPDQKVNKQLEVQTETFGASNNDRP